MDVRSSIAAQGYAATRPATQPKARADGPAADFAKMANDFTATIQQGEQTALSAMSGDADPHALVQALAQTELAVETAVTIRNKVVEAYQEILRCRYDERCHLLRYAARRALECGVNLDPYPDGSPDRRSCGWPVSGPDFNSGNDPDICAEARRHFDGVLGVDEFHDRNTNRLFPKPHHSSDCGGMTWTISATLIWHANPA